MANNKNEEEKTDWVAIGGTGLRALGDILIAMSGPKK